MKKEVFIEEWRKNDYTGRRDLSIKSSVKVGGEYLYACKNLTSWFRLGKYIIKHDIANYLLGLTQYMSRNEFKYSITTYDWDGSSNKKINCIDELAKVINEHFSGNDYLITLMLLQRELEGYERCFYVSQVYNLPFDYELFIRDKDEYLARIDKFRENYHIGRMKEKYPEYSDTAIYADNTLVVKDNKLYCFHQGYFIEIPKDFIIGDYIKPIVDLIITIYNKPNVDKKFVTLQDYGYPEIKL